MVFPVPANESLRRKGCILLFRQNPVFPSLQLRSPVHIVTPQISDTRTVTLGDLASSYSDGPQAATVMAMAPRHVNSIGLFKKH